MKSISTWIALSQIMVLSFGVSSCGDSSSKDSKQTAEQHNEAKFSGDEQNDAEYLVDVYSKSLFEIELSKHAREKAVEKNVKEYAGKVIASDTRMNEQIKKLADQKQITLQQGLTEDQLGKIKDYGDKQGKDFDQAYLEKITECRSDMLKKVEKGSEKTADSEIHHLLESFLPELREHLDAGMQMRDHLKL